MTAATGRGCVKTHRADAPSNIDLSERSVFDYFSLRKGKRTPETETALRFYTASADCGSSEVAHALSDRGYIPHDKSLAIELSCRQRPVAHCGARRCSRRT